MKISYRQRFEKAQPFFLWRALLLKLRYKVNRFERNKLTTTPAPLLLIHTIQPYHLSAVTQCVGAASCHFFCASTQASITKNISVSTVREDFLTTRHDKDTILGICFENPQSDSIDTNTSYNLAAQLVQTRTHFVMPIAIKDCYDEGGLWHKLLCSFFLRKRYIIDFGSVEKIATPLNQTASHEIIIMKLRDIFALHSFYHAATNSTLFAEMDKALLRFAPKSVCCSDIILGDMTAPRLRFGIQVIARKFCITFKHEKRVGVLLPNSIGLGITFLALQACGKIPAMLNYSTGLALMLHCIRLAKVKTLITSRQFLIKANLEELEAGLKDHVTLVYLEDIRAKISLIDSVQAIINPITAKKQKADDEAVVLFTSGSEGKPKGVALSHRNLLSNLAQILARLDIARTDHLLNPLPMFHSFGLTAGFLFPLYTGIRQTQYPSPLHYKEIPELIFKKKITILLSTDTFLKGYARVATQEDFQSLRLAVAGAEALRSETRQIYLEKFKTILYEGYGVTETSPVLSVNTPVFQKEGSVGRLFPAIDYRLEAVEGLQDGQRFLVRGPNVMLGYLNPTDGYLYLAPNEGWYDTGDIVTVDEHDFIFIKGRLKRFAKIGGEMVSLSAVENYASQFDSAEFFAALALSDKQRGERIVVLTTAKQVTKENLRVFLLTKKIPTLMLPSDVITLDEMPLLPNGKINYVRLQLDYATQK